jgi:hypothetical protein
MPKSKTRLKVRNSQRVQTLQENLAVESLIISMPMATKSSRQKIIKKLVKNKRNQKNNLAKNFLLTNLNLIAKNNLINFNDFNNTTVFNAFSLTFSMTLLMTFSM